MQEPDYLLDAENDIRVPRVQTMGLCAVLGPYDFVTIVEAPDNQSMARSSVELGVKAGVHITALPTVPASSVDSGFRECGAAAADFNGALPAFNAPAFWNQKPVGDVTLGEHQLSSAIEPSALGQGEQWCS